MEGRSGALMLPVKKRRGVWRLDPLLFFFWTQMKRFQSQLEILEADCDFDFGSCALRCREGLINIRPGKDDDGGRG